MTDATPTPSAGRPPISSADTADQIEALADALQAVIASLSREEPIGFEARLRVITKVKGPAYGAMLARLRRG